jgi:methionine sulfoxide reductase catalytic subunit
MDATLELGFPLWIRLTHFFNFLFITLLIRSGIEIIGAHPKFYWRDDSLPGSEWLRLTRKEIPKDEIWTAEDEIEPISPWTALPGLVFYTLDENGRDQATAITMRSST